MATYHEQLTIDAKNMISLISTDIYAMEKGMRQCCNHQIPAEIWNDVKEYLKSYFQKSKETTDFKVSYKHIDIKEDMMNFYDVFIYKYHHQLEIFEVIEKIEEYNIGNPRVLYISEWMKGALFGSSSEANERYLMNFPKPDANVFKNL